MINVNKRCNQILHEVVDGKARKVFEYSELFQVSSKSIRNDVKEINELLRQYQQPQIVIDDKGELYFPDGQELDPECKRRMLDNENYYTYKLLPQERQIIMLMHLLNAREYITIAQLSDLLFLSRNTVRSDLEVIRGWVEENGLELITKTSKGLYIQGDEQSIRNGIMKLFLLNVNIYVSEEENIFRRLLLREFDLHDVCLSVERVLQEAEEKFHVRLAERFYRETVYWLTLMVNRLKIEKKLKGQSGDTKYLKNNYKYEIGEYLLMNLGAEYEIEFSEAEVLELTTWLMGGSYFKNQKKSGEAIDVQLLTNEFISKIFSELKINFYLDFHLYDLLQDHIRAATWRVRYGYDTKNPLLDQLYDRYGHLFDIVKKNLSSLEAHIGEEFSLHELSFIVMYIAAIIEEKKLIDTEVKVVVACSMGRSTAQYVAAKVQSACSGVKIVDIISTPNVETYTEMADVVISTMPVVGCRLPTIQIDLEHMREGIQEVGRILISIQDQKQLELFRKRFESESPERTDGGQSKGEEARELYLTMLLSENRVAMDVAVDGWRQAVRTAGELLEKDHLTDPAYTEAMISIIETNGPYVVIYPGIALAHAEPTDGCHTTGISVVRLEQPVPFYHDLHDPVKYVFGLSIADSKGIDIPLYRFTKILNMNGFVEALEAASTPAQLIATITQFEKKV